MRLFDTDVLIEHLKGNEVATDLLVDAAATDGAACSVLTRFELMSSMRSGERSRVRDLLSSLTNIEVSEETATRAGEWARVYRHSHPGISAVDYLIAATTEVHGLDLLTTNLKHFPMFPELESALPGR